MARLSKCFYIPTDIMKASICKHKLALRIDGQKNLGILRVKSLPQRWYEIQMYAEAGGSGSGWLFAWKEASWLRIALQILFTTRRKTQNHKGRSGPLNGHVCWSSLDCNLGKEYYTYISNKKQKSEHYPQQTHPGPKCPDFACASQRTSLQHIPWMSQ